MINGMEARLVAALDRNEREARQHQAGEWRRMRPIVRCPHVTIRRPGRGRRPSTSFFSSSHRGALIVDIGG